MKSSKISRRIIFGFLTPLLLSVIIPQTVFSQAESLGAIKFTPPKGWNRTANENAVTFSEIDQKNGKFCTITLYGAAVSTGNPQADFSREWQNRVVQPFGADPKPETVTEPDNGWIAIAGGAPIDLQGTKAFAFLTVASGFGKTVSVLGLLNDNSYLSTLQSFVEGMDIDKTATAMTPANTAPVAPVATAPGTTTPRTENGRLVIPPPSRQLTVADLAGQWGENDGINTRYVDRQTGAYAGFESLHFTNKMTITAQGGFYNDFFAIQNGRKIKEDTKGTIAISGRVLTIRDGNPQKYVIRGWLELPDMTILEICGPWYNNDEIPAEIFSNPNQGANLNRRWVRKK
jgi:hypothetical protein